MHITLEIQQEENQKRQERIHRRQQEIAIISKYPLSSATIANINKKKCDTSSASSAPAEPGVHSAQAGDYTTEPRRSLTPEEFNILMQTRQQEYEQRQAQRKLKKERKELLEYELKHKADQDKMLRLLTAKLPPGRDRTTKANEERERVVSGLCISPL